MHTNQLICPVPHVCLPAVTFLMHVKLPLPSLGLSKGKKRGEAADTGQD